MLRRLSDVTIGSLEKILNINSGEKEKKRKISEEAAASKNGSRLRKSKGQWDLSSFDDDHESESSDMSVVVEVTDQCDTSMVSSDLASDLSINEEEWTDYLSLEQEIDHLGSLKLWNESDFKNKSDWMYWNDLYKSMKMRERREIVFKRGEVLRNHVDLSYVMRAKLINWLFEVAVHYKLQRETVYSSQILIDSYLILCDNSEAIPRTKLQLIGLACLLISAKLEEIRPPNLHDLVQICDDLYSAKDIAKMELDVCSKLKWNLTPINAVGWLRFYMNNLELMGVTDQDFKASHLSAALIFHFYTHNTAEIEKCTGLKMKDLQMELDWLKTILSSSKLAGKAAYACDQNLSDQQFEEIIDGNKKALKFILNQIKLEEAR